MMSQGTLEQCLPQWTRVKSDSTKAWMAALYMYNLLHIIMPSEEDGAAEFG